MSMSVLSVVHIITISY